MKDRKRDSVSEETIMALANEGIFVDGRGTFKVGGAQIHPNESALVAKAFGMAVNKVAQDEGESIVRQVLETPDKRADVIKGALDAFRNTETELLIRRRTSR